MEERCSSACALKPAGSEGVSWSLGAGPNGCVLFQFLFLSEVLQWRAQTTPDHVLYTLLNCRVRHAQRGFPAVPAAVTLWLPSDVCPSCCLLLF